MQVITLPDLKITIKGDDLEIQHLKTKTVAVVTTKQLINWAIVQLRKSIK
jgi:hypothetical protein